jgi:hypothetical protein
MCCCKEVHDRLPLRPISIGILRGIAFRLRWVAAPHEHVFHRVAANTWACRVEGCSAWYGEQAWSSGV